MSEHPTGPGAVPPMLASAIAPLRTLTVPWGIAGGWALDLVMGRVTRPHHDVDVAIFRADQAAIRVALAGWELDAVVDAKRRSWIAGTWLALPTHEIHAVPPIRDTPELEFLLNERDGSDWVFRRNPEVRRPVPQALIRTPSDLLALAPEIVLLYKAKTPRAADELDFAAARPYLGAESRAWLSAALDRCHPGHPWRAAL